MRGEVYRLGVPEAYMSLHISLTILRGEADLYVDIDNKVGKNHNAYKSEHVGSDVVFINGFEQRHLRRCAKHDDKSFPGARGSICEYFVAVVGKPGARYILEASLQGTDPSALESGVPAVAKVLQGSTVYFAALAGVDPVEIQVR